MSYANSFRAALLASGVAVVAYANPALAQSVAFDVPAQPASTGITAFADQADVQILVVESDTRGKQTRAVRGTMTVAAGLSLLIEGSGLFVIADDGRTITLGARPQDESAGDVEALIVTAQKKEEAIQDVPIAISAFTQKSLDAQKIEGGFDLLKAIPNVTFSKNNFTGYNFSIRGIGTKAISATTDPGVAVSFNNTTLIVNRLFEQEYFDVERVEVLRGPQGTLYGRNATSGVINVISAKPRMGQFEGELKLEGGNYNAKRARGVINIPLGETLAVRIAGAMTKRDGYGLNLSTGDDVDDRDLWSTRVTVGWEPNERLRASLLWERFEEDDGRVRTSKQLCHRDPGPSEINWIDAAGQPQTTPISNITNGVYGDITLFKRAGLSQGCLPGSLYDDAAFGTPNGFSLPYYAGANFFGVIGGDPNRDSTTCGIEFEYYSFLNACRDPYASVTQSHNLREIESLIRPEYRAKADIFDFSFDFDLTDALTLSSQTLYTNDEVYSTQDFNRFHTVPIFNDTAAACGNFLYVFNIDPNASCEPGTYAAGNILGPGGGIGAGVPGNLVHISPGGVFCDPQLGCSDKMVAQDLSRASSSQFNQELRLASNFDGAFNFSVGANYTRFDTVNDYFVFINVLTHIAMTGAPFNSPGSQCLTTGLACVYIDPNPLSSIDGDGHNYFRSKNPYKLTSVATFGELYWQMTDTVKLTAGLRLTWDKKTFTPHPSQLLLADYREVGIVGPGAPPESCSGSGFGIPWQCGIRGNAVGGKGYPADPDIVQQWREPTGRIGLDWKPDLAFTDESMLYAFYSRGYKGGGANPPSIAPPAGLLNLRGREADASPVFKPEFIDAFELGSKNTLFNGAVVLNAAAFYYDYRDYQVSKIVDRTAANENFDATVWGLELEGVWSPTRGLRFNMALGYLDTQIGDGEYSIDLMDRTQGDPNLLVVRPSVIVASNCVVPADQFARSFAARPVQDFSQWCPTGNIAGVTLWPRGTGPNSQSDLQGLNGEKLDWASLPNAGAGHFDDVSGNELPNAPHWTVSLGAQYRFELPGGWDATARADGYLQGQSFARVYNTMYDKLHGWGNVNLSVWVENPEWGVTAEVYVKNATDETPITDAFLNSDDSNLTTNVFTLDPRLVGVSVRKSF